MISHVAWKGLLQRRARARSRWHWRVCVLFSTRLVRLKLFCDLFADYLIQAARRSMISKLRSSLGACRYAIGAPSTGVVGGDISVRHERDQRPDEGGPRN